MKCVIKIHYVKNYPECDNFILSVDGHYCQITYKEDEFWESCKDLLSEWGFKILEMDSGLIETPYGKSGLKMCFSTSQKAILLALFLKYKNPDKEYFLNMTEVAFNMYGQLFDAVKDSNITLVTKVPVDSHLDGRFDYVINGLPISK